MGGRGGGAGVGVGEEGRREEEKHLPQVRLRHIAQRRAAVARGDVLGQRYLGRDRRVVEVGVEHDHLVRVGRWVRGAGGETHTHIHTPHPTPTFTFTPTPILPHPPSPPPSLQTPP